MRIYHYHPETRVFIGVSEADESPLEPGMFLLPANATVIAAPSCDSEAREVAMFQDGAWCIEITPLPEPEPEPIPPPNPTLQAIAAIEATITQRRMREAALTDDGKAWLAGKDAAIAALRAQL